MRNFVGDAIGAVIESSGAICGAIKTKAVEAFEWVRETRVGSAVEGAVGKIAEGVTSVFEGVGGFFKSLFSGEAEAAGEGSIFAEGEILTQAEWEAQVEALEEQIAALEEKIQSIESDKRGWGPNSVIGSLQELRELTKELADLMLRKPNG